MKQKFPNVLRYSLKISLVIFLISCAWSFLQMLLSMPNNSSSNLSLDEESIKISKEKPEFQEIQIPDNGLSKLIKTPPGRCYHINAPGWLEYYFLTRNGYIKDDFRVAAGEQKRSPKIDPSLRFKLKGEPGIAKIWLQPCPRNSRLNKN